MTTYPDRATNNNECDTVVFGRRNTESARSNQLHKSTPTSNSRKRGRTALRNDKLRAVAQKLGISVRQAKKLRAADPSKAERRWNQRPNAKRDSAYIRARLGYTRADGSLQHIGGVTVSSARRETSAKQQLFDHMLKVEVPRLLKRLQTAARRVTKATQKPRAAQSAPNSRTLYHAEIAKAIKQLVKLADPTNKRQWNTALAAAILSDQVDGNSGWGGFCRMLDRIADDDRMIDKLLESTGFEIPDDDDSC